MKKNSSNYLPSRESSAPFTEYEPSDTTGKNLVRDFHKDREETQPGSKASKAQNLDADKFSD